MKQKNADKLLAFAIAIGIMFWMAAFVSLVVLKPTPPKPDATETIKPATVRIHDLKTGAFFCSGFVVRDGLVITAAHCLAGRDPYTADMVILDSNNFWHLGTAKDANGMTDLGLIRGDFRSIKKIEITTHPMQIETSFVENNVVTCGFPYGGSIICAPFVTKATKRYFQYTGKSVMYPGMSGGPVVDLKTGKVIALNTGAAEDDTKIVSPLVNFCNILNCN